MESGRISALIMEISAGLMSNFKTERGADEILLENDPKCKTLWPLF